jgi:hypothetical protein
MVFGTSTLFNVQLLKKSIKAILKAKIEFTLDW